MKSTRHPHEFISANTTDLIRKYAAESERIGHLHPEQLKVIYEHKWLRMFLPEDLGGLNYTLPEVLRLEEALAWVDGSTGWFVTLCGGAAWFAGFLNPSLTGKIFQMGNACIAGSGATTGTAERRDGGYIINGMWRYATGSIHATMFTANCIITENGNALYDESGSPQVKAFIFFPGEVSIVNDWNTMGMIATASHGFRINDLRVPAERSFVIDGAYATARNAVFQYPFLQLAETTLAVNYSGMAQRFLDLCRGIIDARGTNSTHLSTRLQLCQASLDEARCALYGAVQSSWACCAGGEPISTVLTAQVSDVSYKLYNASLTAVHTLYPSAGLAAADPGNDINRVWRNLYTASQHTLFALR